MRPNASTFRAALAAITLAVAAAGCSGPTAADKETTRLSVYLKDAPGEVKHAVVTIDRVYLQGSADAIEEVVGDTTDTTGVAIGARDAAKGRAVLSDEDVTVDLLTLVDDPMALLENVTVPAGDYAGLRIVVSGGYVEVENGDGTTSIYASSPDYEGLPEGAVVAGRLKMPSFRSSGLKIQFPGSLEISGASDAVLIDFDVSRSFGKQAGNSGMWIMHPTLKGERTAPPAP